MAYIQLPGFHPLPSAPLLSKLGETSVQRRTVMPLKLFVDWKIVKSAFQIFAHYVVCYLKVGKVFCLPSCFILKHDRCHYVPWGIKERLWSHGHWIRSGSKIWLILQRLCSQENPVTFEKENLERKREQKRDVEASN